MNEIDTLLLRPSANSLTRTLSLFVYHYYSYRNGQWNKYRLRRQYHRSLNIPTLHIAAIPTRQKSSPILGCICHRCRPLHSCDDKIKCLTFFSLQSCYSNRPGPVVRPNLMPSLYALWHGNRTVPFVIAHGGSQ